MGVAMENSLEAQDGASVLGHRQVHAREVRRFWRQWVEELALRGMEESHGTQDGMWS